MQSARIRMDQQQQYKAAAVEQLAKNYALKLDGESAIHVILFHHLPHTPQPFMPSPLYSRCMTT